MTSVENRMVNMNFKDAIRTLKFKKNNGSYHQLYTIWGEKLDTSHVLQEYLFIVK